jgi:uncharacterized membrane protein
MESKNKLGLKYAFALLAVIIGLVFNYLNIGREFLGFKSVGLWLVWIGFLMIGVISMGLIFNKKRIIDERMELIALKSSRITFVSFIIVAFVVMIIDGIKPITLPYSLFMSYLICFTVFVNFASYYILLRYY